MNVIPFPAQPPLRAWRIAEIAAGHGVAPDDLAVTAHGRAAIDLHGQTLAGQDPDLVGPWAVDPATGTLDAARLLDRWVASEIRARDMVATHALAAGRHARRARPRR